MSAVRRTLARPASFAGVGLHSGVEARLRVEPAPAGQGLVFVRADLPGAPRVPVAVEAVVDTRLATTLGRNGVRVGTVEHLLAALLGAGVDDATLVLHGPEVPALDGSAAGFARAFAEAGLLARDAPRPPLRLPAPIELREGARRARLLPADRLEIDVRIDFPAPVGAQRCAFALEPGAFSRELAWARTFGFLRDVEALRRMGLAKGGSLDNAVVFTEDGPLNEGGLRAPDEPARHKALDLLGDLALLGRPLLARVEVERPGHGFTAALARAVLAARAG